MIGGEGGRPNDEVGLVEEGYCWSPWMLSQSRARRVAERRAAARELMALDVPAAEEIEDDLSIESTVRTLASV